MIGMIHSAIQGLHHFSNLFADATHRASRSFAGLETPPQDDLAGSIVDMKIAQRGFETQLKTIETADEVTKSTLDILA